MSPRDDVPDASVTVTATLPLTAGTHPQSPTPRPLSLWVTALCSVLVLVLIIGFRLISSASPLMTLEQPAPSLERLVTRGMDLREALRRAPGWERALHMLALGDEEILQESLRWYEALAAEVETPEVELQRLILLAEAGRMERVTATLERTDVEDETTARAFEVVAAAYGSEEFEDEDAQPLLASARDVLGPGWFSDTLTLRLSERAGDAAAADSARAAILRRGQRLLNRVRAFGALEIALLVVAFLTIWRILTRRHDYRVGDAPLPPPWSVADGIGLFARGTLAFIVIGAVGGYLLPPDTPYAAVAGLVAGAPMLLWVVVYLRRRNLAATRVFGIEPRAGGRRLVVTTIALVAVSSLGNIVIAIAAAALDLSPDWTEGFLEGILWGPSWLVAAEALDMIVWAPLVEEIAFRGVLYASLRSIMGLPPAALLSAGVFALSHGYGVLGFASVLWSGALWAVGYEWTRSVVPGILAHAADNLLVVIIFITMLRLTT